MNNSLEKREKRVVTPARIAGGLSGAAAIAVLRLLGFAGEVNAGDPFSTPTPPGATATATPTPAFLPDGTRFDVNINVRNLPEPTAAPTPVVNPTIQAMFDRLNQKFEDLQKTPTPIPPVPTATPTLTRLQKAQKDVAEKESQLTEEQRKLAEVREAEAAEARAKKLADQKDALINPPATAVPTPTLPPTPTQVPTTQEILQKIVADLEREAAEARAKAAANDRIDRLNRQIEALSNTPTPKPDLAAVKTALINQAAKEVAAIQATATASVAPPSPTPTPTPAGGGGRSQGGEGLPWWLVLPGVGALGAVGFVFRNRIRAMLVGPAAGPAAGS